MEILGRVIKWQSMSFTDTLKSSRRLVVSVSAALDGKTGGRVFFDFYETRDGEEKRVNTTSLDGHDIAELASLKRLYYYPFSLRDGDRKKVGLDASGFDIEFVVRQGEDEFFAVDLQYANFSRKPMYPEHFFMAKADFFALVTCMEKMLPELLFYRMVD